MLDNPYGKTVADAARVLDGIQPDWRREVDLDTLMVSHPSRCVLGQVFGGFAIALLEHKELDAVALSSFFCEDRYLDDWKTAIAS